jgi:hypothetical protein
MSTSESRSDGQPLSRTDVPVPITAVQVFWAACALIGLIAVGWASSRISGSFLAEIFQSWSATTVALDLLLLGVPVVAFAVIESRRLGMRLPWIWIPLALPLPGAFLIPLFFLLRERALIRQRQPSCRSA